MPLRIATFNLKDFFLPRSDAERAVAVDKFANVAANLRRADADVVALQEVGEEQQVDRLLGELSGLGYAAKVVGTADRRGIRCVILSRLPVLWSEVHTRASLPFPRFVDGDAEPFPERIPLRRGVVHVRVASPELGEVDVLTAHFKSNLPAPRRARDGREVPDTTAGERGQSAVRSLVLRAAEALFVRGLVDDALRASPGRALCVLGDLNDHLESLAVRIVRGVGEPGKDTLRSCAELLPEERRYSCLFGEERTLIDHVLASARLFGAARSFAIFNEQLRDHGAHGDAAAPTADSDHALCVAEFAA